MRSLRMPGRWSRSWAFEHLLLRLPYGVSLEMYTAWKSTRSKTRPPWKPPQLLPRVLDSSSQHQQHISNPGISSNPCQKNVASLGASPISNLRPLGISQKIRARSTLLQRFKPSPSTKYPSQCLRLFSQALQKQWEFGPPSTDLLDALGRYQQVR